MLQGAQLSAKCAELKMNRIANKPASSGKLKELCKHGHRLFGDNLYIYSDGTRRCLTCKNEVNRLLRIKTLAKRSSDKENEFSQPAKVEEPLADSHAAWLKLHGLKRKL